MDTVFTVMIVAGIVAIIWFFAIAKISQRKLKKSAAERTTKIRESLYSRNGNFTPLKGDLQTEPLALSPLKEAAITIVQKLNTIDQSVISGIKNEAQTSNNEGVLALLKTSIG
jgi:hypothetical protein